MEASHDDGDEERIRDRVYRLVSDGTTISKLNDSTTHDSRNPQHDTGGVYKMCDIEEESRLRDEVVGALHRHTTRTDRETGRNDSRKTEQAARKALRTRRLQHALERAGQFVGGKEERDVALELDIAEAWVKQHLRPWVWGLRVERYRKRMAEVQPAGEVWTRFNGIPVNTLKAAKQWLTQQGVQADEEAWSRADFQVRRLRSGGRAATELIVEVKVSTALRQLFVGNKPNAHPGVWCEFVDRCEHGDDASGRTAILRPVGAGAAWSLRCFTELWQSAGAEEGEIREVMLAALQ